MRWTRAVNEAAAAASCPAVETLSASVLQHRCSQTVWTGLVHGVCAETSTSTTLKTKTLEFGVGPALARCRRFHTHQGRAFVSRCWVFTVPVKAEEDLQYKSAYKHWDVGCVWLSHWMGGWMLSLLHWFYIRLKALVQTEHLSMHESFRLEIWASCHFF